jgi:drug/metabolite transporter (DMT)-like permease
LGLASAASWGGSDFVGGIGARRAPALLVVASGHIFSLFVLLAICIGMRFAVPGKHDLIYAAVGGFEGSLALAVFYRALAMGAMGLTAALCGLLTALVPVSYSVAHEGLPSPLTGVGLAMGLAAIWLITHTPEAKRTEISPNAPSVERMRTALLLGALAGVGFGTQLILFKMVAGGGALWAMTSARAAGVVALLIVLVLMPPKGPWQGFWLTGIAAGALDTIGNLFYFQASRFGRLDVAALVCSLYPAVTILLAAVVLREWPARRQVAGMVLALCAVALLSV